MTLLAVLTAQVLPYWGTQKDRKILRKKWSGQPLGKRDSPFHVLITSYQLVCQAVLSSVKNHPS